jgi:hypothetical protein
MNLTKYGVPYCRKILSSGIEIQHGSDSKGNLILNENDFLNLNP